MIQKSNIIILIATVLLLLGCRTVKEVSNNEVSATEHVSDSIVYIERVVVDTVQFPADTLRVQVPIELFSTDTVVVFEQGRATTQIVYKDSAIYLTTTCDSLEALVLSTEKVVIKQQKKINELKQNNTETVVKTPWFTSWWLPIGLLVLVLCFFIFKLKFL